MLEGANYSWFGRFNIPEGEEPKHLQDVYDIALRDEDDRKLEIGQLVREDVEPIGFKAILGVQVSDLLASGLRRCLRSDL